MSNSPILQIPEIAPTQTDKTTTINDMIIALENATQAQMAVSFASGNAVTLTLTQLVSAAVFACSGQTAAATLTIPLSPRVFLVRNTSGSYGLTVKGATGTTASVAANSAAVIQCDGTNCTLYALGGPGPAGAAGATGPAGPIASLAMGAGMLGSTLTGNGTLVAQWQVGSISALASNLLDNAGTLGLAPIASNDLLANTGTAAAAPVATTLSALLDAAFGSAEGDILTRGASAWNVLTPGTSGQFLQTQGSGALPVWAATGLPAIASNDLLANTGTAAAAPVATTLTALIDAALGSTQGDVLYRSATAWSVLTPGTSGQVLTTGGASANPSWGTGGLAPIASNDLLANTTTATAAPVATTLTALLDAAIGATQGDILYRGATAWSVLAPGTSGQVLASGGAGANPAWAAAASGLPSIASNDLLANTTTAAATPIATTLTALIDAAIGSAQGDVLFRNATSWSVLAPGVAGQFLQTNGNSSNPQWAQALSGIAAHNLLGNVGSVNATPSGVTLTAFIDAAIGNVQGDILYRSSSTWSVLAPGTSGQVLTTGGAAANPAWATAAAGLPSIASNDLLANTGTAAATPVATTLTALIDAALGSTQGDILYRGASAWSVLAPGTSGQVLTTGGASANPAWAAGSNIWNAGTVTAIGNGLTLATGTLDIEASAKLRTVPFSIVGTPSSGQVMPICLTQAGTLLANGGTPKAYVGIAPTATETLVIKTINSGTINTQGTISISTAGSVTWPTFSAVAFAAGDVIEIVNEATADATFGNACLSMQFQVT